MTKTISATQLDKAQQPTQRAGNDEVNLREIGLALGRHPRLIASITGSTVLISGLYALSTSPVWEGQFQIVLEQKGSGQGLLSNAISENPMLAQIAGLSGGGPGSLETEVKILESPSVLMPVYQFVRQQKQQKGIDVNGLRFSNWVKNVKVDLQKGTSILDISYRDTDKQLILPVARFISQTYQDYSGRDRARGITQSVSYLKGQIADLKVVSENSMREAQGYALDNNLPIAEPSSSMRRQAQGSGGSSAIVTLGASSIDGSYSAAQSMVNSLKQQIADAKAAGQSNVHVAPQLAANTQNYSELQRLQSELEEKSALLKPNDQSIQALKRLINSKTVAINQQTIGLLEGQLKTAQAELKAVSRPRDVVLKHRELMRKAYRDERTLAELEGQLQMMQLEKARQTEPWQLISTPTLIDWPVAPSKKGIVALGFLAGLVVGSGAALVVDRRRGLVFSKEELQQALPCAFLKQLKVSDPSSWVEPIELLAAGPLSNPSHGAIALIPVGDVPSSQLNQFSRTMQQAIGNRELKITTDLIESRECSHQLLLVSPGGANRLQLEHLKMRLALQGKPVAGWIFLD